MALESGTYISDLVATNPVHTDGLNNADGHLRLLKTTIQNTFPNINAAVTTTDTELNALSGVTFIDATLGTLTAPILAGSTTVGGTLVLKGAGAFSDIKLSNISGILTIKYGSSTVAAIDTTGNMILAATQTATKYYDNSLLELLPSGVILKWHGSVVSIPANYYLCNGSNGTPDLRGQFIVGAGGAYSPTNTGGGGTVTSSSDGTHAHGAATASGGSQSMTGSADSQGAHTHGASTGSYGLTISDIPPHTHGVQMSDTGVLGSNGLPQSDTLGVDGGLMFTNSQGGGNGHAHSISSDGAHTHNITVSSVNAHQHSISSDGAHTHTVAAALPPYYSLCYIMKA